MLFESTTSHLAVSTAKPTHFLPVESGCRASAPLDITPRELRLWCRATTALSAVFSNSSPPFLGKRRFVPANWVFKPPPFQRPRLAESAKAFVSRSTQLSLSLSLCTCVSADWERKFTSEVVNRELVVEHFLGDAFTISVCPLMRQTGRPIFGCFWVRETQET